MASYKWKTPRSTSRGTRPPDTRPAGQRGPRRLEAEERKQRLRDAVSHREPGQQATQGGHPQVSSCRSISGLQQDPSLCRDPASSHVSHRLLQVGSVPGQQRRGDFREPHPAAVSTSAGNGRSACGGRPLGTRESAITTRSGKRGEDSSEVRATASVPLREGSPALASPHERGADAEFRTTAHFHLGHERHGVALGAPGMVPLPVLPRALGICSLAGGRSLLEATPSGQQPVRARRQRVHAIQLLRAAARHVRGGLSHRCSAPGLLVREALGARLGRHRVMAGLKSHSNIVQLSPAQLIYPGGDGRGEEACKGKQTPRGFTGSADPLSSQCDVWRRVGSSSQRRVPKPK